MLSRSASSPLLRSIWISDPPSEALTVSSIRKLPPPSTLRSSLHVNPIKKSSRTASEHDLKDVLGKPNKKLFSTQSSNQIDFQKQERKLPASNLSISTMSLETCLVEGSCAEYSVSFGGGGIHSGGRGGGGGGDRGDEDSDWEKHGFGQTTDQYYQELIKANPANALVLGNYAKFLKEVKGDFVKAEEYLGRAILSKANDGQVFSMYGGLMWDVHRDTDRAKCYFHRAVEAAPDDCYVRASYARFLWDAEEDEEDDEEDNQQELLQGKWMDTNVSSTGFSRAPWTPPIATS